MNDKQLPRNYCREKAAADGSSFYYAVLFYPELTQRLLIALQAFYQEISEVITECSDPGVARIKFQWWRDEIQRVFQESARHPLGLELSSLGKECHLQQEIFIELIDVFENRINQPCYESELKLQNELQQSSGKLWSLFANVCGINGNEIITNLHKTACCIERIQLINHFNKNLNRNFCYIDLETLKQNNLTIDQIHSKQGSEEISRLLNICLQQQADKLDLLFKDMSRQPDKAFLFGLILNRLYASHCRKQITSGLKTGHEVLSSSPLNKLWIAWRLKRKYG